VVLSVCHHLDGALAEMGHQPLMTREADTYLSLPERCQLANREGADLFLSIHANAAAVAQANGFEVWTSPGWTPADPWATAIWSSIRVVFPALHGRMDMSDGDPDKESKFYVLVNTTMPAVLVETAFISNLDEERKLADPGWRLRMAGAIASAVYRGP
jgi:N-acetylmuramoyl-L-alanine amidase